MTMLRKQTTFAEEVLGHVVDCEPCEGFTFTPDPDSHDAAHYRQHVVRASAEEMNRRGVDFQPSQRWTAKHKARRRAAR